MKSFYLRLLIVWPVFFFLMLGGILLDLTINPWIKQATFHWWMFFTTEHAISIWYFSNPFIALIFAIMLSFLVGLGFAIFTFKD